jgi:hypothetical protein
MTGLFTGVPGETSSARICAIFSGMGYGVRCTTSTLGPNTSSAHSLPFPCYIAFTDEPWLTAYGASSERCDKGELVVRQGRKATGLPSAGRNRVAEQ